MSNPHAAPGGPVPHPAAPDGPGPAVDADVVTATTGVDDVAPGSIVVGVDGSSSSSHALRWAAEQAHDELRPLVLVHGTGALRGDVEGLDQPASAAVVDQGSRLLDAAVAEVTRSFPDLEVRVSLAHRDARTALLDAALDAEMLVVGARGRGPVARLVLGSVSAATARHSPCPVAVVRPRPAGGGGGHTGAVRDGVVVGVDAGGRSRHAVELAFRLASSRGMALTVLHCSLDPTDAADTPEVSSDTVGFERQRRVLVEAVEGLTEKFPDVALHLVVGRRLAEDSLLDAAERMDVVVVGAHQSSLVTTLFDRHTDRALVAHAASVVVVVPEAGRVTRG